VFVPAMPFQSSPMFDKKARSLPRVKYISIAQLLLGTFDKAGKAF